LLLFGLNSCKKNQQQDTVIPVENKVEESTTAKINPFTYENIKKARLAMNGKNGQSTTNRSNQVDGNRLYDYIKFNPRKVTGDILKILEADSTIQIMKFPFANGELYTNNFNLNEANAKALEDGNLYAVVKQNTIADATLKNSDLNSVILNELYLPEESDTALQFQALLAAGYTQAQLNTFRICLLKRPNGYVRYVDQETGNLRNVKGMAVWGLVFGIPIWTHTDNNGYYNFPWRFSWGTIMGTKAKNNRVNIKPLFTEQWGNSNVPFELELITYFITGSLYIHGWVNSCDMRGEVNFEFNNHDQKRYWAQLMDAVNLHDGYTSSDRISKAPNDLVLYAHWDDNYGSASAPMLHQIVNNTGIGTILSANYLGTLLGGGVPSLAAPIFNLLSGMLPDITVKVGANPNSNYSRQLMQTTFHELSHASHFERAGNGYWLDYIKATLKNHTACGYYGCGDNADDGNVAVGESWAEFLGTVYARRLHGNVTKVSIFFNGSVLYDDALEKETWFANYWIPTGIYNDLIDVINSNPFEDNWDRMGGLTIKQLYEVLGPNIDGICEYEHRLLQLHPYLNWADVNEIFIKHDYGCF
jgi:hypothetical protein